LADDPQRKNILDNIVSTLESIQAGSTYHITPARVTRESTDYTEVNIFPVYVVVDGPESFTYFGKRVVNSFTVFIRLFDRGEQGFAISDKMNKMITDVKTALVQDVERGGYASNTEIISIESDEGWIAPYIASQFTLRISYLTLEVYR